MTHSPSHHGALQPHHQTLPSDAEEMYFATLNQAKAHLIQTVGEEKAHELQNQYGDRLTKAVIQWRGAQIAADTLYSRDGEGKLQVAALPVVALTMALDSELGGNRARGHAQQGHAGHALRTSGERAQG